MAFELIGPYEFRGGMDPEGHREYKVKYKVGTTSNQDGPAAAMQTAGLPAVGSTYAYSATELDIYAWRQPNLECDPISGNVEGDFPYLWSVTCTFSTKPRRVDQEQPQKPNGVEDPLSEPQKVSGSFTKEKEQGSLDRRGKPIRYSSFEPITGPLNEWDSDKDQVTVEQNVPMLGYEVFGYMKNTLNDRILWGFPPRAIKLSGTHWRKNYGKNNSPYYVRTFTFDIRVKQDVHTRTTGGTYTSGQVQITSFVGRYSVADIGRSVTGNGIQSGTIINNVSADGSTLTLSLATTGASNAAGITISASANSIVGDWDRDILDESTKCLAGFWDTSVTPPVWEPYDPDGYDKPENFQQCFDINGNPTRLILDGFGSPWDSTMSEDQQGKIHVEYYRESNFLLLGIPLSI